MGFRYISGLAGLLASCQPALASTGIAIPEPSDPWLFGLGVAGLLVGRRVARRRPPD